MKFKVFCLFICLFSISKGFAGMPVSHNDLYSKSELVNVDSLIQFSIQDTVVPQKKLPKPVKQSFKQLAKIASTLAVDTQKQKVVQKQPVDTIIRFHLPAEIVPVKVDSLLLSSNPFFIDLVFKGLPTENKTSAKTDLKTLYYGYKPKNLSNIAVINPKNQTPEQIVENLRSEARTNINRTATKLYLLNANDLPDPNGIKTHFIAKKPLTNVEFDEDDENPVKNTTKLVVKAPKISPWQYKATSIAQFSESIISQNWYQGGNSNLAVLGILSGQLSYDDKKSIQWDNFAEWRMGFNSVAGDSIHPINTNDDILRINSKLGIKAGGNFFYSGSVDFSTQFFNSFKGINSYDLKAGFLAPVRLNIGVGLDYKYQKIFSLMVSPFSYKYIYVNPVVEPIKGKAIDPNLFGVKTGENVLSEIGSSLKATYSSPITKEIQLDSRFSFYTNYQKVEIDWEIVANMSINRFLSTRISFNPRYDNTVIEKDGSKAKLQFKQFLSVGFSHKFF